jgi:FkbM family methyltransferase
MLQRFSLKLNKLFLMTNTPGSLQARWKGCYFELYKMMYTLFRMGITPRTILDIGANRGMFSKCAHYVFPDATIYAFEPLQDCYEELCSLKSSINNLECFNVAVGAEEGESDINRSSYDYSSSLLEMEDLQKEAFPFTAGQRLERVRVQTLDGVLDKAAFKRPVLMKIDVQGYESYVLQGARGALEQTDYLICEFSLRRLYKGQALFDEMYRDLVTLGFHFRGQLGELRHPKSLEVLQIDGLFSRSD